jgi:hypothetical protein
LSIDTDDTGASSANQYQQSPPGGMCSGLSSPVAMIPVVARLAEGQRPARQVLDG